MKRGFKALSISALATMGVLLAGSGGAAEPVKKAKSVDELIKMFDSSSCKQCHQKEYEEWSQSLHAKSLIGTPRTLGSMAGTVESLWKEFKHSGVKSINDITADKLMFCMKCHAPQVQYLEPQGARELAELILKAAEKDEAAWKKIEQVNINCVICHQEKAIVHKWLDGDIDRNAIYGKKEGSHFDPKFKTLKKSPVLGQAVFCGQCHGTGPNFEFPEPSQCATAYGSYLHAYIPSGGAKVCQDCHMREDNLGHKMPAYRDERMVKKALNYSVDIQPYYYLHKPGDLRPSVRVVVKMHSRAGHRIPDG